MSPASGGTSTNLTRREVLAAAAAASLVAGAHARRFGVPRRPVS